MEQLARQLFSNPLFWGMVVVGAFLLLLFVVSLMERRLTRPYVAARTGGASTDLPAASALEDPAHPPLPLQYADDTPDPNDLPEYVRIMSDAALLEGFVFDRVLAHAKTRGSRSWPRSGSHPTTAFSS